MILRFCGNKAIESWQPKDGGGGWHGEALLSQPGSFGHVTGVHVEAMAAADKPGALGRAETRGY